MRTSPEDELEQWIDQELHRLPDCAAPDDLTQRVLDQVRRRRVLPWWQQSLWQWPLACRWLVLALLIALSLAVVGFATGLWRPVEIPTLPVRDWVDWLLQSWGGYQRMPKAFGIQWNVPGASTWLLGAGLFCALVYALVVGIGSILLHLTVPAQSSRITRNV